MGTHQLPRSEWKRYFDFVSKVLLGKHADVDVESLKLGDQIHHEGNILNGLVYDSKNDLFEVIIEDHLDHLIYHPKEIYVDDAGVVLRSVDVIDADGNHQIVRLKEPLQLPPPEATPSG